MSDELDGRTTHAVAYEDFGDFYELDGVVDGCDAFSDAFQGPTDGSPQIGFEGSAYNRNISDIPAVVIQRAEAFDSRELSTTSAKIEYCPFCGSEIELRGKQDDE